MQSIFASKLFKATVFHLVSILSLLIPLSSFSQEIVRNKNYYSAEQLFVINKINLNLAQYQECYQKLLDRKPDVYGLVGITLFVGRQGLIKDAHYSLGVGPIVEEYEFDNCLISRIKQLDLSSLKNKTEFEIEYPFFFVTKRAHQPVKSIKEFQGRILGLLEDNRLIELIYFLRGQNKDNKIAKKLKKKGFRLKIHDDIYYDNHKKDNSFYHIELFSKKAMQQSAKMKYWANNIPRIYPFLTGKEATLLSFYDDKDSFAYKTLPNEIRKVFDELYEMVNDELDKINADTKKYPSNTSRPYKLPKSFFDRPHNPITFGGEYFRKTFPKLANHDFCLVGKNVTEKSKLKQLDFFPYVAAGQNQVKAAFKKKIRNPIFAFSSFKGKTFPQIKEYSIDKLKPPFKQNSNIVIMPISNDGILYIGSIENTASRFDMLWNPKTEEIIYLDLTFGYCLGNERQTQNKNYLIRYGNQHFILRNSEDYSELLSFPGNSLIYSVDLADERAPEI